MADPTLPFAGSFPTDGVVFEITQPSDGGIAVQGSSFGTSQDGSPGTGVFGNSNLGGTGVFGQSDSGPGVQGESDSGSGVVGVSKSAGVWAESIGTGPGLFAKGASVAGHFEGDVQITGNLNVAGNNFSDLIKRIERIEAWLRQSRPEVPTISANLQVFVERNSRQWEVTLNEASLKNSTLRIVIVNATGDYREFFDITSDGAGFFRGFIAFQNSPQREPLFYAATDFVPRASDPTGIRWSDTLQVLDAGG